MGSTSFRTIVHTMVEPINLASGTVNWKPTPSISDRRTPFCPTGVSLISIQRKSSPNATFRPTSTSSFRQLSQPHGSGRNIPKPRMTAKLESFSAETLYALVGDSRMVVTIVKKPRSLAVPTLRTRSTAPLLDLFTPLTKATTSMAIGATP